MLKGYTSLLLAACTLVALVAPGSASASTAAPGWEIFTRVASTNLPPGGTGQISIQVYNVGKGAGEGPTITDVLPAGVKATSAFLIMGELNEAGIGQGSGYLGKCSVAASVVSCTAGKVPPGAIIEIPITVAVEREAAAQNGGEAVNRVTASGGGAATAASQVKHFTISSTPAGFGFSGFDAWLSNADGTPDTQAGSHPYGMTVEYSMNSTGVGNTLENVTVAQTRNIVVGLPPGIVGNATAVPRCTRKQFDGEIPGDEDPSCPPSTQVGLDQADVNGYFVAFRVYNLVPPPGMPAQFGFMIFGIPVFLDASVRTGGTTPRDSDYGISVHTNNIPEREIIANTTTIWGVPGEEVHNNQRGGVRSGAGLAPLLTLPTSCEGPLEFTAESATNWENENITASASSLTHNTFGAPIGITGCGDLGFQPAIFGTPETSHADTPSGVKVEVRTPQHGLLTAEGFATSNVRDATVTLPEGVAINPGQAAGLVACPESEDGIGTEGTPSCPPASKVGTVEVETPLLNEHIAGNVYIMPNDPPNIRLLFAGSAAGVNVKLLANVHLNETTGQLVATLVNAPEVPFSSFKLTFSGGAQAALMTPLECGTYETVADVTPWSTPLVPDAFPYNGFVLDSGPGGAPCSNPVPFQPVMTSGSTTDQAGGYTDFTTLLTHSDGEQRISRLQFKTPEGLLGMISQVKLCPEPEAAEGTCTEASQIGHTVVDAGAGPDPLVIPEPGQPPAPIYVTGPYEGAPYGLSIVVPVKAGPFNLGTIIVRGRIEVDRRTSQLTVTTDPLPTIIDGVPADLRAINAVIDRPNFMFNPTSCAPLAFTGTAFSTDGRTAPLSTPLQVGSCRALTFKPDFQVSAPAKYSRVDGASLDAKIIYPTGVLGHNQASSQSNIEAVKVELPKQLPSRLSTLQKACPGKVFEANPAQCPAASVVGRVRAVTPVLSVELIGPAYFVSHGGEAFPSLIMVLQGEGVTVEVVGSTYISKQGITSSTFRGIPDVPVTLFELVLPQGPDSALTGVGNLCKETLRMPTDFIAQDGATLDQSTKVTVTGCTKAKKAHKAKKTHKAKKKARKAGAVRRSTAAGAGDVHEMRGGGGATG